MELLVSNIDDKFPTLFKKIKNNVDKNIISDINNRNAIYENYHNINFLKEFGIIKNNKMYDLFLHRIVGNIPPHVDNIDSYCKDAYMIVLDIGTHNNYIDTQESPLFFQNNEFLSLRVGDIIKFRQDKTHALFYDRRIDIGVFWQGKYN